MCWELMILIITINVYLTLYLIFLLQKKCKTTHSTIACKSIQCMLQKFYTKWNDFSGVQGVFLYCLQMRMFTKYKKNNCALSIDHQYIWELTQGNN